MLAILAKGKSNLRWRCAQGLAGGGGNSGGRSQLHPARQEERCTVCTPQNSKTFETSYIDSHPGYASVSTL